MQSWNNSPTGTLVAFNRKVVMNKEDIRAAYIQAGSVKGAATLLGIPRDTYRYYQKKGWIDDLIGVNSNTRALAQLTRETGKEADSELKIHGNLEATAPEVLPLPPPGEIKRFILTSAQNNTLLNDMVWNNLVILSQFYKADIFVGTYTYNKSAYGKNSVKFGTKEEETEGLWFDNRLLPHIKNGDGKNIELAPGLIWCGRANIIPTAERPLSGFETYTGRSSGIFPHAKIAMHSIPSGKFERVKFNYTTGTITQRNYIQKKAGMKAEHHHTYGALVVEIDHEGTWFVRQINADSDGTIHDLDIKVERGRLTRRNPILAMNWGDIHVAKKDPISYNLAWGKNQMMDTLKPSYQFMHDLIDFHARSHHNKDHYSLFMRHKELRNSVEEEMQQVADFLAWADRPFCKTVIVDSNHDNAFLKWLREADYREDPVNALYFLKAQLAKYESMEQGERNKNMVAWALTRFKQLPKGRVQFLGTDESFVLASIEFGMHGHLGPNGARGNPKALSRIGRKANTGHTHSAEIHDGLYVAGVTGLLDHEYNVGPSSWSQSHIATYGNGKRAIITISNNKWRL